MKLVGLTMLAALLLFSSSASAEILTPPGGPVEGGDDPIVEQPSDRPQRADRQRVQRNPRQQAKRARLRHALVEQFDLDGDGRLGPRERMRAARVLRRIEQRLSGGGQRGGANYDQPRRDGAPKLRRFIQRYDVNGDGDVGPREVPAGAADRLRRFDSDGDGWVEPRELGGR